MNSSEETNSPVPGSTDGPPDMAEQAREYVTECISELLQEYENKAQDMSWMAPNCRSVPAVALGRIKSICQHIPDIFGVMQAVAATHSAVPREVQAMALKKFRPDLDPFESKEVVAMLTSIVNGGRSGYDSVIRNRKKGGGGASSAALPWGAGTE